MTVALCPIVSLVLARLRQRAAPTALAIAAVAAATALIGIVAGIALVATDITLSRSLAGTGADRPVVRTSTYSPSSRDATTVAATAATALEGLTGPFDPTVRGVLVHELLDLDAPVFELIVAVDDPGPWTTLVEGRLPAPCLDGVRCEAVLLAEDPGVVPLAEAHPAPDLRFTIVGRGLIDRAIPFGDLDQRGPFGDEPGGGQYQTGRASPAVLLVNGVDAIATSPALEGTGRTYLWTTPLQVDAVHPWTVEDLRGTVERTARALAADRAGFGVTSPLGAIDETLARAAVARDRSLLVLSLGIATLLAFAVYLALVSRDDVRAEIERLDALGARRWDRWLFVALEAAVPVVIGGLAGWLLAAGGVALIALWTGTDLVQIVAGALFDPGVIAAVIAVPALAMAATAVAVAPGMAGASVIRIVVAVAITGAVLLGWPLIAGTAGAPSAGGMGPVLILLPASLAFLVALALAAGARPLARAAARRSTGRPLAIRLALLSIAREPSRPAATVTLLAFSVGAIVFASGWTASLDRSIEDGAAYRSGLDLRVTELGTGASISGSVVPISRYSTLGGDVRAVPVYRDAATADAQGRTQILAIPPNALGLLPGWRADFADAPLADLAARLDIDAPAEGWVQRGHRLGADATELELRFRWEGRPLRLEALVATTDGDTVTVHLGDIDASMHDVRAALPASARGGLLTTLILRNPGLVKGSGHQDELRRATVTWLGLDGLVDERPIDVEIFTTAAHVVRAPATTDDLRLPAIVSPDLAAEAGPDGALDLQVTPDGVVRLRVVGVARRMPTMVEPTPRFVVVPLDPWLVAVATAIPGAGRPNEMWLDIPDDPARRAAVRGALADDPFRFAQVIDREARIAADRDDPLRIGIIWTLIAAAAAGLALALGGLLLGTATDLADRRGEAADLEAQGVAPSILRGLATTRTAVLVSVGAVAGMAVGVLLSAVVIGALPLTADGLVPIPPLVASVSVPAVLALVGGLIGGVVIVASGMARRTYGRRSLADGDA